MGLLDTLLGSSQGGGTQNPPQPSYMQPPSGSILDVLGTKQPAKPITKPKLSIPEILGVSKEMEKPVNPLIKTVMPTAVDDYNKFAEKRATTEFYKQNKKEENSGLSILSGNLTPAEPKKSIFDKVIDTASGVNAGIVGFGKSLISPVVQMAGAGVLPMFQAADYLSSKAAGKTPAQLSPEEHDQYKTMLMQGLESTPQALAELATFGGEGAFAKIALPTAVMQFAISEMQGKGLKTSSMDAVKHYAFTRLFATPLGKKGMAALGGGAQLAQELMTGENPLSPKGAGEIIGATGLGYLGGRGREKGYPLGETAPLHEKVGGGGEEVPTPKPVSKVENLKREISDLEFGLTQHQEIHNSLSTSKTGESADFSKNILKSTGQLPEMSTGKGANTSGKFGTGKDTRTGLQKGGDDIASELGFGDYEQMRGNQEAITKNKENMKEISRQLAGKKIELKEALKSEPAEPTLQEKTDTNIAKGEKMKGLLQTLKKSENLSPELKARLEKINPQTYKVKPNEEAFTLAKEIVKSDPAEAKNIIFSDMPPDEMKGAIGDSLILHHDTLATKAKSAAERNLHLEESVNIAEAMDSQRREAGRFIQTASAWNKLSPEALQYSIARDIKKAGGDLTKDQMVDIRKLTEKMKEIEGENEKARVMDEIVDVVSKNIKPTRPELVRAYLYQNMLLGKAIVRNAYQNFVNTFVTRPADILSLDVYDMFRSMLTGKARTNYFSDIPKYYRDSVASVPNAIKAYGDVIAGRTPMEHQDLMMSPDRIVSAAKQKKMPKVLTIAQRHMEAGDRMFSVLIGQGEKARLMRSGVPEGEAIQAATKLSTEYLARNKLDYDKSRPVISRALDSIGRNIMNLRNQKTIGPIARFFVPFVATPTNVAKFAVEHSVLGFFGGSHSDSQISRAMMGSLITASAGVLAANGQTTWIAPTDKEARQRWYDAGNKPYSVRIGNKWVPITYFGPYALAIGMVAAFKHYQVDEKEVLTDSQMMKMAKLVGGLANFMSQQTSTQGYTNFYKAISGDADYSAAGSLGFSASQIIPLSALQRDINKIIDNVYRKGSSFESTPFQSILGLSSKLPSVKDSKGKPAKRELINTFLPYDIGKINEKAERDYQSYSAKRQKGYQQTKIKNTLKDKELSSEEKRAEVKRLKGGGGLLDSLFGSDASVQSDSLPAFNPP